MVGAEQVPLHRRPVVLFDPHAVLIGAAEHSLGSGQALARGFADPLQALAIVPLDRDDQHPQREFALSYVQFCGLPVPLCGLFIALLDAEPEMIGPAQIEAGLAMTLLRGFAEPARRFRFALLNATPLRVEDANQVLAAGVALLRSALAGREGTREIRPMIGIECFANARLGSASP